MEKNIPLIISVTGWSGSGKTTFCEKLIKELLSRGLRVAAAKNSHRTIETDKAGSDSRRFFEAGAEAVCLNSGNSMTLFYHKALDSSDSLAVLFPSADIIVAEGFKSDSALRIELTGVFETAEELKNPLSEADLIVYAGSKPPEFVKALELTAKARPKKPVFIQRDNIKAAADFICNFT
jgi:molybdopterin-guanine dinucleotide biosynthesis protein B